MTKRKRNYVTTERNKNKMKNKNKNQKTLKQYKNGDKTIREWSWEARIETEGIFERRNR